VKEKSRLTGTAREMRWIVRPLQSAFGRHQLKFAPEPTGWKSFSSPLRFASVIRLSDVSNENWHWAGGQSRQQGWYHGPHPVPWRGGVLFL